MKDKSFFKRLRMVIAAGSVAAFVGGWAMLAQADQMTGDDSAAVAQVSSFNTPTTDLVVSSPTAIAATPTATPVQPTTNSNEVISPATVAPTSTTTTVQITTVTQQTTSQTTTSKTRLRTGGS
jgi:hypothetical protein